MKEDAQDNFSSVDKVVVLKVGKIKEDSKIKEVYNQYSVIRIYS